jgi:hypothetical protein
MPLNLKWANSPVVLSLVVCLSACAGLETGKTKLKRVKTVGIVSAIGDEFSFARAGLNGNYGAQHFPIAQWGVDDLIVSEATASIGEDFQVQPLTYQRETFYTSAEKKAPVTPLNLMHHDPLKALLRNQVSPQSLDAYVVIVKAESKLGPSERTVAGIGAVQYGALLGSYYQIHALYEIKVYDGHSFDLIETRAAAPLDNNSVSRLAGPSQIVDQSYMPSAGDPVQNEKLRAATIDMIERSLQRTLQDLHLSTVVKHNEEPLKIPAAG